MRESLQKVRDTNGNNDSDDGGGGSASASAIAKWLHHVSAVLRGAAASAESLLLGYPVLVHCSDGWDRTAQISALSQLLLDPYYRTIEGFLMLIEKEWMGFGFQFEERMGRMTDKGTSPVFTQFLDCVWQLLNQYPTEFEFGSGFLEVFIMCAYSGLFSSFRHDCERQRVEELALHAESTLNTSISIVHFSSVFTYIHILLASSMAALLVNPKYKQTHCAVKYLHPRFGVEDLTLWAQGLLPRGFSSFSPGGGGGGGCPVLSRLESEALSSSAHASLLHQTVSVLRQVPLGCAHTMDVINGSHHGTLLSGQTPHENAFKVDQRAHRKASDISVYRQVGGDNSYVSAVIRVQLWFRGISAMRKAFLSNGIELSSVSMHKLVALLMTLFHHSRLKESLSAYVIQKKNIASILDDVIEFVIHTCDEMQRTCPDLMSYEEGTTRGTLLASRPRDDNCDSDFGDTEGGGTAADLQQQRSRSVSKSSDRDNARSSGGGKSAKPKATKNNMTTNFFSKISKGFQTSKKDK
jgi:hypothetical protein